MTDFDVFNGDADGICALQQLRLAEPRDARLITGIKRDIELLKQVDAGPGDRITVLDISLDRNRDALEAVLNRGAQVLYVDHHFAGEVPQQAGLEALIDTSADVCTSLLVNRRLQGRYLGWAVAAAFGDNLFAAAREAAKPLGLDDEQLQLLEQLGTYINYNGYGNNVEDLFFDPAELYGRLRPYQDPLVFAEQDEAFRILRDGYAGDMDQANTLEPADARTFTALYILPDAAWARRVSGVMANHLARQHPDRAHAILSPRPKGGYLVSVRAPLNAKRGAADLCRQFDSGGGREAAAGINQLPESELHRFESAFRAAFDR